jgi:hypothetical protein
MFPPPGAIGCSRGLHANGSNIKHSAAVGLCWATTGEELAHP